MANMKKGIAAGVLLPVSPFCSTAFAASIKRLISLILSIFCRARDNGNGVS